jgi:hypothetical protein
MNPLMHVTAQPVQLGGDDRHLVLLGDPQRCGLRSGASAPLLISTSWKGVILIDETDGGALVRLSQIAVRTNKKTARRRSL